MPRNFSQQEKQESLQTETKRTFENRQEGFSAEMEARYQAEMEHLRERNVRKTGLVALLLYGAFAFSDRNMVPDVYQQAWQIRFFAVMPLMVLCTFFYVRLRQPIIKECLLSITILAVGLSLPVISGLSSHPNSAHYQTGITLVVLFGNIVLNIRFRSALITSGIMSVVYAISLMQNAVVPMQVRFNSWLFFLSAVIISLIANYRMDRDQRRAYLARSREQARNEELREAVSQLEKLSAEDALTQAANRREFDRRLNIEWGRARRDGQPLALVLLDVDCFKAYNDHYGHPAGDACLQQVAAALRGIPQRSSDLVARVGGEEFIVLLPQTDVDVATQMAERMRDTIAALQIPHAYSNVAPVVTGSFGVAAVVPDADMQAAQLLASVDAALYCAKENGRNCVVPHIALPAAVAATADNAA